MVTARYLILVCIIGVARVAAQTPTLQDLQNKLSQFEESSQKTIAELKAQIAALQAEKTPNLYYLEGANLLGDDGEATVDGSHPTDLGFTRQAAEFERVLRPVLR